MLFEEELNKRVSCKHERKYVHVTTSGTLVCSHCSSIVYYNAFGEPIGHVGSIPEELMAKVACDHMHTVQINEGNISSLKCKDCGEFVYRRVDETPFPGKVMFEKGVKHDDNKAAFALLPPYALQQTALVATYGAKKYADRNWEKGIKYSRLLSALHRHVNAFERNENKDPESQYHHLAHAAWCCLALLETHVWGDKDLDDRSTLNPNAEKI